MKINLLFIVFISMFVLSCNKSSDKNASKDPMEISLPTTKLSGKEATLKEGKYCYQYVNEKDTFDINFLVTASKQVSGTMIIDSDGKDVNMGTIQGTINKDVISVNYRFLTGDQSSIRNMNLKVRGNLLITGTGQEEAIGDSAFIRDKASIQYDGLVYHGVKCE